ncbi:MAG: PAS domain S-box protein [Methylotetracoccus sp.]
MERLRQVIDSLDEGVCLLDSRGRVQALNPAAAKILRWDEALLVGRNALDTLFAPSLRVELQQRLDSAEIATLEPLELKRRDGGYVQISLTLHGLFRAGTADGAVLRFRPLTQAVSVADDLADRDTRLRVVLDTIVDGVVAADEGGVIQLFNSAAETLFGYRADEVIGRNVRMLMPSPEREAHDAYLASYLRTGQRKVVGIGREVKGCRKDGSLFPLHLAIGEASTANGRLFVAVLHDLTLKRFAEQRLSILSAAVEQSPNAVLLASLEGIVEYVNPSFTALTGYESDEVVGRNPSALRVPHTAPEKYQQLWKTLLDGGVWQEETRDRKKSGEMYWAIETISPIRNAEGVITHFLSIQQDITEQKQAKEALQQSEERFRQIAEMTGEWLWEQDPGGRYIYSSGAVRDILGYEPEEIIGKRYLDLLTLEDRLHWTSGLVPIPDSRHRFYRLINRYRHKNGREVFTESSGEPLFDDGGSLVKWRGVDHNVTSRKQYEDALRLRDRAIESASVGINITDALAPDTPNIYVNPALCRMTGYTRAELIGKNMRNLQGPETDPETVKAIGRALAEGRNCEVVLRNYRKDGTAFWNELLISPVRDESGRLTHYVGIQTDVTERLRAQVERHELEIARQIQMSLLPKDPLVVPGFRGAGVCVPAAHVGGDYFDYFSVAPGTVDALIADVSGHNVGAALVMAGVRSTLKAETRRAANGVRRPGVADILGALNELLFDDLNRSNLFITMFYLRFDTEARTLSFANAGHNRPLLCRSGSMNCELLDAEGMILGIKPTVAFEARQIELAAGDRLLLYTDGIVDAENAQRDYFGVDRLARLFASGADLEPERMLPGLLEALHEFRSGSVLADDVTLLAFRAE